MKRLVLMSAICSGLSCFAQTDCNPSLPLFKFDGDQSSSVKEIHKLGTAPEFPFLRNMSSPRQVADALKRNDDNNTAGISELNDMLMAIGFNNGIKDVDESNITMYRIPPGTEGNMGSAGYSNVYCKLDTDPAGTKSWKISSGNGCYMYVLAKCGNAFYPKTNTPRTACINVPVNVTGDMTLNSSGQTATTTDKVYIYYAMRRHHRHGTPHPIAEIPDAYPSRPLLLSTTKDVQMVPETYKLTVNTPDNTVTVCPDSTLTLPATINVEKTSEYSGYYPSAKTEYKKVSKRVYRRTERKMRRAKRLERRVARITGVHVDEPVASK